MGLLWDIINRPTGGETRRAMLYEARRANNLKQREVEALEREAEALERLAKQRAEKAEDWSDDR